MISPAADGQTQLTAVIGSPIRHSLSPAIFNAAFRATDLNWMLVAFEVVPDDAPAALAGARALGIRGLSVTMPLKVTMAHLVDDLSPTAARLDAVNSLRLTAGGTEGDNTDGRGLLSALAAECGWDAEGRRCVVLGGGGAARSVVLALGDAGAASVVVVNRSPSGAEVAATLAGPVGRVGGMADVPDADLVVNATSVGMAGTPAAGGLPLDPGLLHPDQLVVDLVYHPRSTPLLDAARARGAATVGGVGMLVHQAARQFAWWTGQDAPIDAMQEAARLALR